MAQDQRVDWLFAAQVTGQNELQRLTLAVGKMREEIDALKTANGGLAVGMANVSRSMGNASAHVQAYRKHLDEQAKAMRNTRQGTQQLGMQFNDLGTSIATGASPIQAFNQQLGQIGYALSMMEGRAGAVGAFLAGPWGAAITIATMVLGPMITSLFDFKTAAENARKAAAELAQQESESRQTTLALIEARFDLGAATKENIREYRQLKVAAMAAAQADMASATVALEASLVRMTAAQNEAKVMDFLKSTGPAGSFAAGIGRFLGFGDVDGAIKNVKDDTEKLRKEIVKSWAAINAVNNAGSNLKDDKKSVTKDKISDAEKEAKRMAEAYAKEQEQAVQGFLDFTAKIGQSDMSQYQKDIAALQERFGKMGLQDQARYVQNFNDSLAAFDIKQINKDYDDLVKTLDGGLLPAIAKVAETPTPAMTAIQSKADELRSSFESVGKSVSDAFQGMLTGATSFKDGMKSIISSVISELWRLYVVQQIVGFFTGTVMPAAQSVFKGKALGGSVGKNQPYMVGERGPELFIPGGSGTIIPNRNLGGGGGGNAFNINVDARGSADPAAVRAQVQQGILEAAPAIIAAAEARTVNGLRRPRLGGVMQ